ncbi:tetratricopeptide repeat protein [Candidatus Poribacteria bacterium]|nr:tetratricopeptide repeat protein [Candidatus Poribacteria bacterium]MYB00317.1 tetratricopeptide repeat protein [Candidatus Poribacteria bacterium]
MPSKQIWGLLLIILLNTALLSFAGSEESFAYYSPENILRFADSLYAQGDYLRAAGEYQRYLFYQPQESAQIHYKIAICYRFGGKTEQAIQGFEALLRTYPEGQFASRVYYQIGATYFLMDRYEQSSQFLHEALPRITDTRQHAEAEQLIGLSYLRQKRWSEAGRLFKALQASDVIQIREKAEVYHIYAEKGAALPTRSPFLAGTLSAIVPGAGRLYTGRFGDVLNTLFTVGLTGWQAYDGFRRDGLSSAKGWTLGTLCGIFYVGNIYGSVISARVYNRHITDEFLATLLVELPY